MSSTTRLTLAVTGLFDQVDLMAFASAIEAQPGHAIELLRSDGVVGMFSVDTPNRAALLDAFETTEGFEVRVDSDGAAGDLVEVTAHRTVTVSPRLAAARARLEREGLPPIEQAPVQRPRLRIFGRGLPRDEDVHAAVATPAARLDTSASHGTPPEFALDVPSFLISREALVEPDESFDAPIDAPSDAIVVEPTAVEVEVAEALAASAAGHASALREAPSREQWSPPLTLEPFAEPESEPVAVLVGDVAVEERGLLGPLVREELRLVVGPLDSFAMVHAFQSKVTGLHGVRRVVVGRFFRGILNLTVDYEGVLPLTTWLPDLGDFAPIAMTQPDHRTIEITLPS